MVARVLAASTVVHVVVLAAVCEVVAAIVFPVVVFCAVLVKIQTPTLSQMSLKVNIVQDAVTCMAHNRPSTGNDKVAANYACWMFVNILW